MKTILIQLNFLFFSLICIIPSQGQIVSKQEAAILAQNWITMVTDRNGNWGGYENASIASVKTLEKDNRKLGYFCHVAPKGFILVSIRKELAPVKLYSDEGSYPSDEVDCLPDLIYDIPAKVINVIETELAPIESVSSAELKEILEIDYSEAWDHVYNYMPGTYTKKTTGSSGKDGYQEGDFLLTSSWRQGPPYNDNCPVMPPPCGTSNGRAIVGCVATSGSQIMDYWDWPPYGVAPYDDAYDWPNIPDSISSVSPQAEKDAVAELCAEVGAAVEMNYGCDESGAWAYCPWWNVNCGENSDLESVLVNVFRFSSTLSVLERGGYSTDTWYDLIKDQINLSRPIEYGIRGDVGGHAVVVDGWQELGPPLIKQFHINFGWGGGSLNEPCWNLIGYTNTWYTLDALPCFDNEELMLVNILPVNAIGTSILGEYPQPPSFRYRYFDRDAAGHDAVFHGGQNLQFFPGIKVTGNSTSDHPIRFQGQNLFKLGLFTRGDLSKGVRIHKGEIELTNFGSIKLH